MSIQSLVIFVSMHKKTLISFIGLDFLVQIWKKKPNKMATFAMTDFKTEMSRKNNVWRYDEFTVRLYTCKFAAKHIQVQLRMQVSAKELDKSGWLITPDEKLRFYNSSWGGH